MRVHIIETDSQFSGVMKGFLERNAFIVTNGGTINKEISSDAEVLIFDLDVAQDAELKLLQDIINGHPGIPVIVTTATDDVKTGVGIIKAGAADCLVKPFLPDQLLKAISTAVNRKKIHNETKVSNEPEEHPNEPNDSEEERGASNDFLWFSPNMDALVAKAHQLVRQSSFIFITGEGGTGKESLARYVHEQSAGSNKPLIELDCNNFSKESFTKLLNGVGGVTIFLDEIENLSEEAQLDLLSLLKETDPAPVDGRRYIKMIVASKGPLEDMVRVGHIRTDLLARLGEAELHLPPLRERRNDIMPLARHFATEASQALKQETMQFTPEAESAFLSYEWEGNLRELRNVVNRMALLGADGEAWRIAYFNFRMGTALKIEKRTGAVEAKHAINLREASAKAEIDFILRILEKAKFNKSEAARIMNISRRTLYNKLRMI